jgi:hypothetical protein
VEYDSDENGKLILKGLVLIEKNGNEAFLTI